MFVCMYVWPGLRLKHSVANAAIIYLEFAANANVYKKFRLAEF